MTSLWTTPTRACVALLVVRLALYVVALLAGVSGTDGSVLGAGLASVGVTCFAFGMVLGPLWLYRAWARVPAPWRRDYAGRRIEPAEALCKLFIPLYGAYWLFVANIGLCSAIERHLHRHGAPAAKTPWMLAYLACLVQLVPVVNLLVAPFLWALFMVRVDTVQAEAERRDPEASALAPLGFARMFKIAASAVILGWVVMAGLFFAIYGFLSPAAPGAVPAGSAAAPPSGEARAPGAP